MKRLKKGWIFLLLCLLLAAGLTACGTGDSEDLPPEPEKDVLIYAALNPVTREFRSTIKDFNAAHPDGQIEIRDYSDEGGRERLQIELLLGQVPDIMELRCYGKAGDDLGHVGEAEHLPGSHTGPEDGYFMPYRQMA